MTRTWLDFTQVTWGIRCNIGSVFPLVADLLSSARTVSSRNALIRMFCAVGFGWKLAPVVLAHQLVCADPERVGAAFLPHAHWFLTSFEVWSSNADCSSDTLVGEVCACRSLIELTNVALAGWSWGTARVGSASTSFSGANNGYGYGRLAPFRASLPGTFQPRSALWSFGALASFRNFANIFLAGKARFAHPVWISLACASWAHERIASRSVVRSNTGKAVGTRVAIVCTESQFANFALAVFTNQVFVAFCSSVAMLSNIGTARTYGDLDEQRNDEPDE